MTSFLVAMVIDDHGNTSYYLSVGVSVTFFVI